MVMTAYNAEILYKWIAVARDPSVSYRYSRRENSIMTRKIIISSLLFIKLYSKISLKDYLKYLWIRTRTLYHIEHVALSIRLQWDTSYNNMYIQYTIYL